MVTVGSRGFHCKGDGFVCEYLVVDNHLTIVVHRYRIAINLPLIKQLNSNVWRAYLVSSYKTGGTLSNGNRSCVLYRLWQCSSWCRCTSCLSIAGQVFIRVKIDAHAIT